MARLTLTLAKFQELASAFGGPVIYAASGGTVTNAVFGSTSGSVDLVFVFSPAPPEAAFLALFPSAVRISLIQA